MGVYTAGADATPKAQDVVVDVNAIGTGDYILVYSVPKIAFGLLNPGIVATVIKGWVNFRNSGAQPGEQVTNVNGVYINTDTGEIDVLVNVTVVPDHCIDLPDGTQACNIPVMEAGVNPIKVLATVGVLFAALGIVLFLNKVVQKAADAVGQPLAYGSVGFILGLLVFIGLFLYFAHKRGALPI